MELEKNTLSFVNGEITLNGAQIHRVTDYSIKADPNTHYCASVTLTFDVYTKDIAFSNSTAESKEKSISF